MAIGILPAAATPAQLAAQVGKDQTFMSIIQRGQRRAEFVAPARAMVVEPAGLFAEMLKRLPENVSIWPLRLRRSRPTVVG